ncbi:glycosyltransferase family 2 protein [Blastococcus deserti]|uniref:Glycosyltransferase family 2 protein n=1 Tax=Blastococcus deserti TaxID=2259033 RepID=A0ABW4XA82_9ACTN
MSAAPPAPSPPRTLSVVVCAYTLDRWSDIEAAIESLRRQIRPADQIILVTDHNPELLQRARTAFPDVVCVPNADARGLSGARNTGVRTATGEVVAFLDDDAVADPAWADRMLGAYREPGVVGVGGRVVPLWKAHRPPWFPDEFLWVLGCSYEGLPVGRADIRNPIGANMSFLRRVFDRVGGFDATMGRLGKDAAGCEETEFAIRARRGDGARIVLEPDALCAHSVSPDRVTRRYFRRRCWAEGRSKALVSALAGAEAALETERAYVRRTLPRGVLRGLRQLLGGDLAGGARAWAIVEGTLLTAGSYLLARRRGPR